ncbi:MAG: dephospho-CoA kinase, partial [Pseudomonadota bacterium]|nr:dephospho-CoA kinase [Pseudomonadota bacterium]
LVVDVSVETQIARTLARDGGEESTVRAIIAAQIGRNQRLEHGDDIIDNDLPLQTLRQRVETLHQQYLTLAKAKRNE